MRISILSLIALISGCSVTKTIEIKKDQFVASDNMSFKVQAPNGPSSELEKEFVDGFCGLNTNATVIKVHSDTGWDSLAKISFSSTNTGQVASLMYYFDKASSTIRPLLFHSDDGGAEPLGMHFSVGEKITSMFFYQDDSLGIGLVPASKLTAFLDDEVTPGHTESFSFLMYNIGFKPGKVSFSGISTEALFEQIKLNENCTA